MHPLIHLAFLFLPLTTRAVQPRDTISMSQSVDSMVQEATSDPRGRAFCVTNGSVPSHPGGVVLVSVTPWREPLNPKCGELPSLLVRSQCAVTVDELDAPAIIIFCFPRPRVIRRSK